MFQRLTVRSLRCNSIRKNSNITTQHPELASVLGLGPSNMGVYNGTWSTGKGKLNTQVNPSNDDVLGTVSLGNVEDYNATIAKMDAAKPEWANLPAPVRGEIVRQIGDKLREQKEPLGKMISVEMGKIYQEGLGEVQEAIDICDFAVGLSRSLNGSVIPSEVCTVVQLFVGYLY